MKKLLNVFFMMILFAGVVFAQSSDDFAAEELGITDSDCKNFAKNYKKIQKEMDKLDAELDAGYIPPSGAYDSLNKVLNKNGISGPEEYLKTLGIMRAYAIVAYEKELDSDRLTKAILNKTGTNPISTLKPTIGKKDYEAVKKNYKALATAFGDEVIEPEKKADLTIGGVIGNALGGSSKSSAVIGKGIDGLIKKKGQSEKIVDHIDTDEDDE